MPALHMMVQRTPPVVAARAKPEAARFVINWVSAAGTGVFVSAILSGLVLEAERIPVDRSHRHAPSSA